jgi:hypothetical protein
MTVVVRAGAAQPVIVVGAERKKKIRPRAEVLG